MKKFFATGVTGWNVPFVIEKKSRAEAESELRRREAAGAELCVIFEEDGEE